MNGYNGERELVTQPKILLVRSFVNLNIMSCGFFGGEFWGFNAKISASCFQKKKKWKHKSSNKQRMLGIFTS